MSWFSALLKGFKIVLPTGSDVRTGDRNLITIKTYNWTNFQPVEN